MVSSSGTLQYKSPPASAANGLAEWKITYKYTYTLVAYPSTTAVQYLTITLKNVCLLSRFTSPSSQNAIYYQDGSNTPTPVTAFSYTSD